MDYCCSSTGSPAIEKKDRPKIIIFISRCEFFFLSPLSRRENALTWIVSPGDDCGDGLFTCCEDLYEPKELSCGCCVCDDFYGQKKPIYVYVEPIRLVSSFLSIFLRGVKTRIGQVLKEIYDATNWTLRWHRTVRLLINVVVTSRAVGGRRRRLGHRRLLRVALKILLRSTCAVFQRHTLFHRHHRY